MLKEWRQSYSCVKKNLQLLQHFPCTIFYLFKVTLIEFISVIEKQLTDYKKEETRIKDQKNYTDEFLNVKEVCYVSLSS